MKLKKFISLCLALLTLGSVAACTPVTPVDTTPGTTVPGAEQTNPPDTEPVFVGDSSTGIAISHISYDPEKAEPVYTETKYTTENTDACFLLNKADTANDAVMLRGGEVSSLNYNRKYTDNTTTTYTMKVSCASTGAPWTTLYFGLRLANAGADATKQSGIWIALRGAEIGIRTNTWPETTYTPIGIEGVDFSSPRLLKIEDDMKTDVISLHTENDSGESVLMAQIKIEDGYIFLYKPGIEKAVFRDKILDGISDNGYFNAWAHIISVPAATISDFKVSGVLESAAGTKEANMLASRDVFADSWVCTDDEGRTSADGDKAANGKKVGIFYFLWHDQTSGQPVYDHTAAYYSGGAEELESVMKSGPLGFAHYWAEPYFGYYRSDDEWVIRKHAAQLSAAGVDFVFFDVTNGLTYEKNYEKVLSVWNQMRIEGSKTPQVMFICGSDENNSKKSLMAVWENLYSKGRYKELWFTWEGKPLILAPKIMYKKLDDKIQSFFTFRQSWAYTKDNEGSWYTKTKGKNCWPWADMYPQSAGLSPSGEVEQMIVMCGFWVNGSYGTNAGRSFHNGKQPANETKSDYGFSLVDNGSSGKGYAFAEQFERAIETDPELVMVTGWNEWWAGRWEAGAAIGQKIANTYTVTTNDPLTKHYYVDCFNPEFSRDIEPVKGLYNDNYYYQLTQNVRRYKGSRTYVTAFGQKTIDITAGNEQWYAVGPEYRDFIGDTAHRDSKSYVGRFHYTNDTGRNDFVTAKVSSDDKYLYFYAECAADITSPEGTNWMNLFIDSDNNAATGWYGYDYLINRSQKDGTCSVEKFNGNTWELTSAGEAAYKVSGNTIQIKLEKHIIGAGSVFDFKWADNSVANGDIMQFTDLGDTAPDGRFNYRYTLEASDELIPDCLTPDMTVLKAGSYSAYANGKSVMLDSASTKATFFGESGKYYVPSGFASSVMKLDISGCEILNHYGTAYVEISGLLASSGKTVSLSEDILVISDSKVGADVLLALYRALY